MQKYHYKYSDATDQKTNTLSRWIINFGRLPKQFHAIENFFPLYKIVYFFYTNTIIYSILKSIHVYLQKANIYSRIE